MNSISWAAVATGVPTLSQTMLILLGLLLMLIAYRTLRSGNGTARLMMAALAFAASAGLILDTSIEVARANGGIIVGVGANACSGGTAAFEAATPFQSQCQIPIRIVGIQCDRPDEAPASAAGTLQQQPSGLCEVGVTLQNGESCLAACNPG